MLKSFARAAAFLVYLFIALEMFFMVTPFALYYYSFYSPLLSGPSSLRAIAWLPAFFLPHLSTEILPSLGGGALSVGLGRLFPVCLSTLLHQVQAARHCTERPLQAHSPSTICV